MNHAVIADLFPAADLDAEIAAGHIARRDHPELPLAIHAYTRTCQYANHWTPVTTRCRGLITEHGTGKVVAWCLPKFFNHDQHGHGHAYAPALPDEAFDVYDKEDGSLGIVFHYAGCWHVASKGAFVSEQARWAQQWLDARDTTALRPGTTYLAEIIYPENRIVVNYHGERTLVLLAVIDENGAEQHLADHTAVWEKLGGRIVRTWPGHAFADVVKAAQDGRTLDGHRTSGSETEGWVIRYRSGVRTKIKTTEYLRLHKVLTGTSERDIWRAIGLHRLRHRDPKHVAKALGCPVSEVQAAATAKVEPFQALLDQVPDEFDAWASQVAMRIFGEADDLHRRIADAFTKIQDAASDRAEFARLAGTYEHDIRAGLFLRLDGKPVDLHVWRTIKPTAADPFATDDEN